MASVLRFFLATGNHGYQLSPSFLTKCQRGGSGLVDWWTCGLVDIGHRLLQKAFLVLARLLCRLFVPIHGCQGPWVFMFRVWAELTTESRPKKLAFSRNFRNKAPLCRRATDYSRWELGGDLGSDRNESSFLEKHGVGRVRIGEPIYLLTSCSDIHRIVV